MFRAKTLFIVGAGASAEAGLVTGDGLRSEIAKCLDIRFKSGVEQISGSKKICAAIRINQSRETGAGDINQYLESAGIIRDAMPRAISIDNFLDAHSHDKKIELCGKLAIAQSLLEQERKSKLRSKHGQGGFEQKLLEGTWYDYFFQILTENVRRSELSTLFENVNFIAFNYDRCVEQFLLHALQVYYALTDREIAKLMSLLVIFHPYGFVGELPWQNHPGISFGEDVSGSILLEVSGQLRTFTEQAIDRESAVTMKKLVQHAERIVFLGFAFHELNMGLLSLERELNSKSVFATAWGLSDDNCLNVGNGIYKMIGKPMPRPQFRIRKDLTCADLFKEYRLALSQ